MEFYDIAGLVRGASKGEGLGNQFLAHIRECDAIVEVVRCFENDSIIQYLYNNPILNQAVIGKNPWRNEWRRVSSDLL